MLGKSNMRSRKQTSNKILPFRITHTLSPFSKAKVGSNHYLPNSGEQCFVGSFHAAPSLAASEDLLFHAPERGNDISSLLLLYVQ